MNDLAEKLKQLAFDNPSHFFHHDSGMHIFYARWIVPFGVVGAAPFSDEAFDLYKKDVLTKLTNATNRDLELWIRAYNERLPTL